MAEADFKPQGGYKELLLGCGHNRKKRLKPEFAKENWQNLITLDINPGANADVVHDLNVLPWPFDDEQFDEIHAYEVLEHLGTQGDYKTFFAHFEEIHRLLKPGGYLLASTPAWDGVWAWGDPGHTRIISEGTLTFLNQDNYDDSGNSPLTDYRNIYRGDFEVVGSQEQSGSFFFVLRKK